MSFSHPAFTPMAGPSTPFWQGPVPQPWPGAGAPGPHPSMLPQGPAGSVHDAAVTQQLLQRLNAAYGHTANWFPTLDSFARVCHSLSPEEQALVQRHLLPATALQLQQMEQRRHDPQAMARVLAFDEGAGQDVREGADTSAPPERRGQRDGHEDAAGGGRDGHGRRAGQGSGAAQGAPGSHGGPGAHARHAPHASHASHTSHAKHGAQGGPAGAAPRGPSSPGPGYPSGAHGRVRHSGHSGVIPAAGPLLPPQTSLQTLTPTTGGPTVHAGWSSFSPSPLNMQGPVMAQWPSASPVPAAPGWPAPVVVAPQSFIAPTPFMPSPPMVWDACAGMVPYPPYPMWNPMAAPGWPGVGFGMPSPLAPCWADSALSGLGMGLGAGIGASIGMGLGHMLGSFAFGHHFF